MQTIASSTISINDIHKTIGRERTHKGLFHLNALWGCKMSTIIWTLRASAPVKNINQTSSKETCSSTTQTYTQAALHSIIMFTKIHTLIFTTKSWGAILAGEARHSKLRDLMSLFKKENYRLEKIS